MTAERSQPSHEDVQGNTDIHKAMSGVALGGERLTQPLPPELLEVGEAYHSHLSLEPVGVPDESIDYIREWSQVFTWAIRNGVTFPAGNESTTEPERWIRDRYPQSPLNQVFLIHLRRSLKAG